MAHSVVIELIFAISMGLIKICCLPFSLQDQQYRLMVDQKIENQFENFHCHKMNMSMDPMMKHRGALPKNLDVKDAILSIYRSYLLMLAVFFLDLMNTIN